MKPDYEYITKLETDDIPAENYEKLTADFIALCPYGKIIVNKGFVTDFNSRPGAMGFFIKRKGKFAKPSVIHDFLYRYAKLRLRYPTHLRITQKLADKIYLGFCKLNGVNFFKRQLCYRGLRLFGWFQWRKYRKND